jgi:hypothetical protein
MMLPKETMDLPSAKGYGTKLKVNGTRLHRPHP